MQIRDITNLLEKLAPLSLQESYDNSGLLIGDASSEVQGALVCLDVTEEIIDEAISKKCNLIIAHHPVIFSGVKRLNGKNYVERIIIKAIKHEVAIYACHTNVDHVATGVNRKIGEKLEIKTPHILSPKKGLLKKITTFCPTDAAEKVRNALFEAGCGQIGNYDHCSFNSEGKGTFRPNELANPVIGKRGTDHVEAETKIECIYETYNEAKVLKALKAAHPYEEVAHDIILLDNNHPLIGSGMYGDLNEPMDITVFFNKIKADFNIKIIRHTKWHKKEVKTIAWCGGSGSFLLNDAKRVGADVFITADFKYHQFYDADNKIVIADVGHFESEQFTGEIFSEVILNKFPKFALHLSKINTNPINYF